MVTPHSSTDVQAESAHLS
nr:unnamed protein product [Callosobruchus chinensis]